jgi:hypothetical protein
MESVKGTGPVLTSRNFLSWKRDFKDYLQRGDMWGAIEDIGELPLPVVAENAPPAVLHSSQLAAVTLANANLRRERKAKAEIRAAVAPELKHIVNGCETAVACWNALRTHFDGLQTAAVRQLKRDYAGLKLGRSEKLNTYFGRAADLREQLEQAAQERTDEEQKEALVNGLTEQYQVLQVTGTLDALNLAATMTKLLEVEALFAQQQRHEPAKGLVQQWVRVSCTWQWQRAFSSLREQRWKQRQ